MIDPNERDAPHPLDDTGLTPFDHCIEVLLVPLRDGAEPVDITHYQLEER
jgi:hypothetical protein